MSICFNEPDAVAYAHQKLWDLQVRSLPRTERGRAKRWQEVVEAFAVYQKARYDAALCSAPLALIQPPNFDS